MATGSFLTQLYPATQLVNLLIPRLSWQPYSPAPWGALPGKILQELINLGDNALATAWPELPATLYLRYARDGDRSAFEAPYFQRRSLLSHLVLAECAENQARFLDAIADAAWSICEESSWCLPAHIAAQKAGAGLPDTTEPIVDLFAAETSALLAWTHYLLAEQLTRVSPLLVSRIEREIQIRILTPALERDDFWWMGFSQREVNNWNPWINSNWLASNLLIETDESRRVEATAKILTSLDRFIVPYPEDGGCDEGPSYWTRAGASVYDCLELLYSASGGKINVYGDPKINNIARYIYRAHIANDYYVNFADAPALVYPDPALVYGFGQRIDDEAMMSMGAWLEARSSGHEGYTLDLTRTLRSLFQGIGDRGKGTSPLSLNPLSPIPSSLIPSPPTAPLLRDVYLSDIQFFAARDQAGATDGLYLAAKGGHNAESHNHNDVGHFIVYHNGRPLIIDLGVETYTRKTFSPQRYEIWTMQSAYHSLPTIGGMMQAPGREFAAREVVNRVDDASASLSLDIAAAYPRGAQLISWKRVLTLVRGQLVDLTEAYEFSVAPSLLMLSLMTPCQVDIPHPGCVKLAAVSLGDDRPSASGEIVFDNNRLNVTKEEISITDGHLQSAWGPQVTRILFTVINVGQRGGWSLQIMGSS